MREIKEIIEDIRETEKLACTKEEAIPYKSRGGMLVAIRTACERLPLVLKELENALIPNKLAALYASGDQVVLNDVAKFVRETGGVVLDGNALYRQIADRIEQSYSPSRTFSTTQYSIMLQGIREAALMFDYYELPVPKYQETICPDSRCTLAHIKKCIRNSIGDDLSRRYLTKFLVESVLKLEKVSKVVPILVLDANTTEEKNILSPLFNTTNTFDFKPNFQLDQKTIVKLFKNQQKVADEGAE